MDLGAVALILALALIARLWWGAMGAKRQARAAASNACARIPARLLDEVALERWALRRDRDGRVRLWRRYRFEFCVDETLRYRGGVELLGRRVVALEMPGRRFDTGGPISLPDD